MYLNVRQPPLTSKLPFNPLTFLFPRPTPPVSPTSPSRRARSPSPPRSTASHRSSSVPIPTIPPASNPRGELIFSSKVDRGFRESYDRYRSHFERRKDERERAAYAKTWVGWLHLKMPWVKTPPPPPPVPASGTSTPMGSVRGMGGLRGRVSGSPGSSRRSSPVPGGRGPRKVSQTHPLAMTEGAPSAEMSA